MRDHLVLALRLESLVPGAVDTRSIDPVLRREVGGGPRPHPVDLVRAARRIRDGLPDAGLDPGRERHLAAQLTAVEWTARRLDGQALTFDRELELVYGVTVRPGAEDVYRAAHRDLDEVLPGTGPLQERLAVHRDRWVVPPARLLGATVALVAALRERSERAGLVPAGDQGIDVGVVADAPWSALQQWVGPGRSRVTINAGARVRREQLAQLVAHEATPGHHAERVLREAELVGGRGWAEHSALITASPQSVVSEGAAEAALAALLGDDRWRWASDVLADEGLAFDAELAERVDRCLDALRRVRLDAALLLHGEHADYDDVFAFVRRWLPATEDRARQVLRFVTDPRWRGYGVTYVEGAPLVHNWLRRPGDTPVRHLRDLFVSPATPASLAHDLELASSGCAKAV